MKSIFIKNLLLLTGIVLIMTGCDTSYPGDIKTPDPLWKLCTNIQGNSGQIKCTTALIDSYPDCGGGFEVIEIYDTESQCSNGLDAFKSDFDNGGSDSSGGSTSAGSCGVTSTSSFIDAQYEITCSTACQYKSAGQAEALSSYCSILDGYGRLGGPGSEGCSACR